MRVERVWATPDGDRLIARIARVSSSNQDNPEYEGLIRYLIKHRHWSPFEMASLCVEIETSRAIAHQITRHRSFSYQEFSQRYARASGLEEVVPRRAGSSNRQGSVPYSDRAAEDDVRRRMRHHMESGFQLYGALLDEGVAPESARFVLAGAATTRLYMAGTVRSWIHYLELRVDEHAQSEHRDVALAIRAIFLAEFPTVGRALGWA